MLYCTKTTLGDTLFFTERGKNTLDVQRLIVVTALRRLRLTPYALDEPVTVSELPAMKLGAAYACLPAHERHGYALVLVLGGNKGVHVRKHEMADLGLGSTKPDAGARALSRAQRRAFWARARADKMCKEAEEAEAVVAEMLEARKPLEPPIEDDIF